MSLTTIINYCSFDKKFIDKNIQECLKFSDNVVVVCCTHFLNGKKDEEIENFIELRKTVTNLSFVLLTYNNKHSSRYWHCLFRWEGFKTKNTDYYLFLDADEIPNGNLFKEYIENKDYLNYDINSNFLCYYYFREPIYRAIPLSGVGLLIKKQYILKDLFFTEKERWFYRDLSNLKIYEINNLEKPKIKEKISLVSKYSSEKICNVDGNFIKLQLGKIMFDHYSWARTKDEMFSKIDSWGHKDDDWVKNNLDKWKHNIEDEFNREFNGKCFIHGWRYTTVKDNLL